MKKFLLGVLGLAMAVFVAYVVFKPAANAPTGETPTPTVAQISSSPMPLSVKQIIILTPAQLELVKNPIVVTGRAIAFENTVAWRLKDQNNTILATGSTMTNAPDAGKYGNYTIRIPWPKNVTTNLVIEVYEASAKDGSDVNLTSVLVRTK